MTRRCASVVLACALLQFGIALHAQTHPSGSTTPSTTGNSNPQVTSGTGKYANFDQMVGQQHGNLSFTGTVTTPNGQLPWDPIPVVVTCNGKTTYNTMTDASGRFRIDAGAKQSEVAPQAGSKPTSPLVGCTVRATLQGYRSDTLTIANRDFGDNPDIGIIKLEIDERAKASATSPTTAAASKDARKSFDKARQAYMENHPDKAKDALEKAVKQDPQFAEAWYQLGKLEEAQQPQDAYQAFSKAAAADPQFLPVYEHLALAAAQQKKWQEVIDASNHGLQLDPQGTPQLWYFNALGNFNAGNKDVAEKSARTSLSMDPGHLAPNTEQLLAVVLASKGAYDEALQHLRNSLTYTPPGPSADLVKQQIAQLEKAMGTAPK